MIRRRLDDAGGEPCSHASNRRRRPCATKSSNPLQAVLIIGDGLVGGDALAGAQFGEIGVKAVEMVDRPDDRGEEDFAFQALADRSRDPI